MDSSNEHLDALHLVLSWMATDREQRRVEREEWRQLFDGLQDKVDRLSELVLLERNQRAEDQKKLEVRMDGIREEIDVAITRLEKSQAGNSSTSQPVTTQSEGLHTARIEKLRDELATLPQIPPRSTPESNSRPLIDFGEASSSHHVRFSDLPTLPNVSLLDASAPSLSTTFPVPAPRTSTLGRHAITRMQLPLMHYDGSTPWEKYWLHVQTIASANDWDSETCRLMVAGNLRGEALDYYGTLEDDQRKDPAKMLEALRRRYGRKQSNAALQSQFYNRRQKMGEAARDFATTIQGLGRDAHPAWPMEVLEEVCLNQFLKGILDSELQCAVRDRYPANLRRAVEIAEGLEENRAAVRESRKDMGHPARVRTTTCELKPMSPTKKSPTRKSPTKSSPTKKPSGNGNESP